MINILNHLKDRHNEDKQSDVLLLLGVRPKVMSSWEQMKGKISPQDEIFTKIISCFTVEHYPCEVGKFSLLEDF